MAEPWLPLEDRIARWDRIGDQLLISGWRAGPAGVSAIELDSGLWAAVDHASPTTLSEVTVDLEDGVIPDSALDPLSSLLGDGSVAALRAAAGWDERPIRLPADDGRALRRGVDHEDLTFARFAIAADLGDDASRSPLARGVALVEGALAGLDLHRPAALRLASLALATLDDVQAATDRKRLLSVSALIDRLRLALGPDPVEHRLRDLADRFSGRGAAGAHVVGDEAARFAPMAAAVPAAAPAVAPMAASKPGGSRIEMPGRPVAVDGDHRAWAWLDPGGNVRVTAGAGARGAWARVFRHHDRLLLGLSPLGDDDGDGDGAGAQVHAVVVIPPTPPDALVVDLVADPARPRRAPLEQELREAIGAGRRAARFTRLGYEAAADAAWTECARRWDLLGDTQRANLARAQGLRRDRRFSGARGGDASIGRPLLADEID